MYEEVAFLSYYLHWDYDIVMEMSHRERSGWIGEVSKINRRINDSVRNDE
ncbi:MAG: DUF6760 family protein [bacterium]